MPEEIKLSVRALVEFTHHGEDITPGLHLRDMQEGAMGHRARQNALGQGWLSEVPLQLRLSLDEETDVLLGGRMDAYYPQKIPAIEEIKLWQHAEPPEAPLAAHWAQVMCYGHMLCETENVDEADVSVTYVTRDGDIQASFVKRQSREDFQEALMNLWLPYARRLRGIRAHQHARDASLRALHFPYTQFRKGQREMAAQVYTAVRQRKRLFASMPTGTGKTAAALFPALKAMGEGWTDKLFYLTARTTQRAAALEMLQRMREQRLHVWTLTLDAKEKQCPQMTYCHPDFCPRAKGHFLRDQEAMEAMLAMDDWTPAVIRDMAQAHLLCPFEFSLSLAELADLTICDYNYALDPSVHLKRIFDRTREVTLLIDEAHHLPQRLRDMLSAGLNSADIRALRTSVGKELGRKHCWYQAMTGVLQAFDALDASTDGELGELSEPPEALIRASRRLLDVMLDQQGMHIRLSCGDLVTDCVRQLSGFIHAAERGIPSVFFWQGRRDKKTLLLALEIAEYFSDITDGFCGTVCFSATMEPLEEMRSILGGSQEDGCFALPSPFPSERLLVLQYDISTRYADRASSAQEIAACIQNTVAARPGRYMVFFPSFAYLAMVADLLNGSFQRQERDMPEEAREAFLRPYREKQHNCVSLCVLGGVFSEGIDLPGDALDGVIIVGVGLPQLNREQNALRAWYDQCGKNGFLYAYQLPGMQKVIQAVGRVIRSERDCGVAVLLDDRYRQASYRRLCPGHWEMRSGDLIQELSAFWQRMESDGSAKEESPEPPLD